MWWFIVNFIVFMWLFCFYMYEVVLDWICKSWICCLWLVWLVDLKRIFLIVFFIIIVEMWVFFFLDNILLDDNFF